MAINTAGQVRQTTIQTNFQRVTGAITFDATAMVATDYTQIDTGFKPTYICIDNVTDRTRLEWFYGMAANTWLKTIAAGTRTLDTTVKALIINDRNVQVLQDVTLGVILPSKLVAYRIEG